MNKQRRIITTAVLLMLFAAAGAGLVGLTHDNTTDIIQHNEQLALLRKLNTLVPSDKYDNDLLKDTIQVAPDKLLGTTSPSIVYRARKQNTPVAVVLAPIAPNGYGGAINLLVGIYADGTLAGVRVVSHHETPGLGDAIEADRSDWITKFTGRSLSNMTTKQWKVKRDGGDIDQFTGATISPRAVVTAVHNALLYFSKHHDTLFASSEPTAKNQTGKS
jgi:Na+-translocating ferredoxin:NAD+ oxidoreductase subunit G